MGLHVGLQGATQLGWLDALVAYYQASSTRTWKCAIRNSIQLACNNAEATTVVRAGLDLKVPAAQQYFFTRVWADALKINSMFHTPIPASDKRRSIIIAL